MSSENSCALRWRRCLQEQRSSSGNKSESYHVTHYAGVKKTAAFG